MEVAIRADASDLIGVGHVMRCASLGLRLTAKGHKVHFIASEMNEWLVKMLTEFGFGFTRLPIECLKDWQLDAQLSALVTENLEDCRWVIVDHYGLDKEWESILRKAKRKVMIIDCESLREHDCDVLLDTSLRSADKDVYKDQLSHRPIVFSGPSYVVFRPEFDEPSLIRSRSGEISKILVFFGGGEVEGEIRKVISALSLITSRTLEVSLVLGKPQPDKRLVDDLLRLNPYLDVIGISLNMANLIKEADLGIGTCGVSALERCALGLPALTVVTADNQRDDSRFLNDVGAIKSLGKSNEVKESTWLWEISKLLNNPTEVLKMSSACLKLNLAQKDAQKKLIEIFEF